MLPTHVVGGKTIITARKAVYGLSKGERDLEEVNLEVVVQPPQRLRGEQPRGCQCQQEQRRSCQCQGCSATLQSLGHKGCPPEPKALAHTQGCAF
eukprot:8579582-Prorocentrum_lima.AAC.1